MTTIFLDIEADNLLMDATTVWCVVIKTSSSPEEVLYPQEDLEEIQRILNNATTIVGHNVLMYDLPVLNRLYGLTYDALKVFDTLLVSRLLNPDREGGHSLKAWGNKFNAPKIEFNDFSKLSDEMIRYCKQDVDITIKVYEYLIRDMQAYPNVKKAIRLEHDFAYIIQKQIQAGFKLDVPRAEALLEKLRWEFTELYNTLQIMMPVVRDTTHRKGLDKEQIVAETEDSYTYVTRKTNKLTVKFYKTEPGNPTSRDQIGNWLQQKYKWVPKILTETGKPKIDEQTLGELQYPEAKLIARLFRLQKQISMIKNDLGGGWLNYVNKTTGRVHGDVLTNATSTGRCSHCVPMDTQALTKSGWKSYEDLEIGEDILAYDQKRHLKVWTPLISKSKFKNRQIGEIGNKSMKFRCTAEHKWVVQSRSRTGNHYKDKLIEANKLLKHHRILINAPYEFGKLDSFECVWDKYNTNYFSYITNYNKSLLSAFLNGFLLADGYFNKSYKGDKHTWYFVQATGHIFDIILTASYLYWDKRISSYRHAPKTDKHRESNTCLFTSSELMSVREGMKWVPTTVEDVWCPETKYGTWVMKQGNYITITGNSKPNVAQSDKDPEMRACWTVEEGNVLVGADASGLELRVLGHYLAQYDHGAFAVEATSGDVHTYNQQAIGLKERNSAKQFVYALVYGAGNKKLGKIFSDDQQVYTTDERRLAGLGGEARKRVEDNLTGYKNLVTDVGNVYKSRGYLIGLDGRPLFPRSDYSALNMLVQSAGAVIMKQALVNAYSVLKDIPNVKFVANIHDEVQVECGLEHAELVGKTIVEGIRKVSKDFNLKVQLDGEYKIGANWSETH